MDPERYQIHGAASTQFSDDWERMGSIPGQPSAASAADRCSQSSAAFTEPASVVTGTPTSNPSWHMVGHSVYTQVGGGDQCSPEDGQPSAASQPSAAKASSAPPSTCSFLQVERAAGPGIRWAQSEIGDYAFHQLPFSHDTVQGPRARAIASITEALLREFAPPHQSHHPPRY